MASLRAPRTTHVKMVWGLGYSCYIYYYHHYCPAAPLIKKDRTLCCHQLWKLCLMLGETLKPQLPCRGQKFVLTKQTDPEQKISPSCFFCGVLLALILRRDLAVLEEEAGHVEYQRAWLKRVANMLMLILDKEFPPKSVEHMSHENENLEITFPCVQSSDWQQTPAES